ncbi:MAG: polyprenyl synthetase family protein [Candidatus Kerfeldbacteria bacterium]|nr:polyprenyl synthetase family protein [Candidatus Kerfeldbacteria bacterium]
MVEANHFKTFAADVRGRFNPVLQAYLRQQQSRLASDHPLGRRLSQLIINFVGGPAKRLRPALVELGYLVSGRSVPAALMQIGVAVELVHHFLLIHDDIIDRSLVRRGRPTVHQAVRQWPRLGARIADDRRREVGRSIAVVAGDLCADLAVEAVLGSRFSEHQQRSVLRTILHTVDRTIVGEALDVIAPLTGRGSRRTVEAIATLKTAHYSLVMPLQVGMTVAGVGPSVQRGVARYALLVGIAFQIDDDVLGVFGRPGQVGKSTSSDLAEGKVTLLTVLARERFRSAERRHLKRILARRRVSPNELVWFRKTLIARGVLSRVRLIQQRYVQSARRALRAVRLPASSRRLLHDLAMAVVDRQA